MDTGKKIKPGKRSSGKRRKSYMKELRFLDELVQRYPVLEPVKGDILKAYEIMRDCYEKGGKLMIAGNGGSCSDSEHIVGELMKGFVKRRPVSAELAQALKAADPQMGEKLAENLQGFLTERILKRMYRMLKIRNHFKIILQYGGNFPAVPSHRI